MRDLTNVEKSAFKLGEYVGYGGGKVWRIRKTLFGGWKWAAHVPADHSIAPMYGDTLKQISDTLSKRAA